MKYLCGCEDDRPAVGMDGKPLTEDYVDHNCYACASRKGPHYLCKLYIKESLRKELEALFWGGLPMDASKLADMVLTLLVQKTVFFELYSEYELREKIRKGEAGR